MIWCEGIGFCLRKEDESEEMEKRKAGWRGYEGHGLAGVVFSGGFAVAEVD